MNGKPLWQELKNKPNRLSTIRFDRSGNKNCRENMNITYLLGAGASFHACPVWKEQGEKMVQMATDYLMGAKRNFSKPKPNGLNDQESILWDIGYFGTKAIEFGTIDAYAKKIHISNDTYEKKELPRLKHAISIFFTLWELSNDRIKERKQEPFKDLDPRYLPLLTAVLEETEQGNPKLKSNIKFVTWNYDLQLEKAYKRFCHQSQNWNDISQSLKFRVNNKSSDLDVCHLNGYHGFYYLTDKDKTQEEQNVLDRENSNNISILLDKIGYTADSVNKETIRFTDHINYAWETNENSKTARSQAESIFSKSDIVVVIGYSFPSFNKEIDKALFSKLQGRKTRIYYQDPNASFKFLNILTQGLNTELETITDRSDSFFIPYEF